jgi:dTDP-4-amino-4,6-dideoxygalactose transaminase
VDAPVGDARAVPFLDVGAGYRELQAEIDEAVARVLAGGWYVRGAEVAAFEAEFASYVEAAYAVGVGNGLDALTLALRALGVGPGDEVLVPSHTYIATWLAVSAVGATPVPVEPDPATFTITAEAVAPRIGPATRAILPVHLYGRPAALAPMIELARDHDLLVVEDAAQAHGARVGGRRIGAHGDAVCWSFYPSKNLGAFGDGGAVTADDPEVAARVRRLANYGSDEKHHHPEQGVNSRLDELQAAVLRVKLRYLDEWNARRRAVADRYAAGLGGLEAIVLPSPGDSGIEPVWHLYVVRTPDRDGLAAALRGAGIETGLHYPVAITRQPPYAGGPPVPVAERLAAEVLSLPIGPHLDPDGADRVVEAVRGALAD